MQEKELEFKTSPDGFALDVEIFAVGKWNGMAFTLADLKEMAKNFRELKEFHRVPLKFGHNNEQPLTDGFPALGWVSDVWVDSGADGKPKLFGRFIDIPKIVFNAIDKRLYKYVSIELDADVQHKGKVYKYVLSGVALLGADLPAVNTIADLKAYMSRDESALSFEPDRRKIFTLDITSEVPDMDLEKLQAELDALKAQNSELVKANSELDKQNHMFSVEKERLETEAKQKQIAIAREKITAVFDRAVEEMRITPAKREAFSKLLGVADDDKVTVIDVAEVEKLCEGESIKGNAEMSFSQNTREENTDGKTAGDILHEKTEELALDKGIGYREAQNIVFRRHPELAKAHLSAAKHNNA